MALTQKRARPLGRGRRRTWATGALVCALLGACGCGGASQTRTATASAGSSRGGAARATDASSLTGGTPPGERTGPARRPNIIFVLTDDLAWNLVPFMPHVVEMERHGATFTNYFVSDSLCCPSRASIFTGRFPHDTHVFDNSPPEGGYSTFRGRGEERKTFATALRGKGYDTALMGKYLNGYRPIFGRVPPGWSEWDVAGNGYPEYGYTMNSDGHVRRYGYHPQDYLTDVLAAKGVGFVRSAAMRHVPFLLEIATFAPHSPFTPAPRDWLSFPGVRSPRSPAFNAVGTDEPSWLSHFTPLDPLQVDAIDRKFRLRVQSVQAIDRMIGRLERVLAQEGLANDTYIVFSSDNGLHMGEHRLLPGKLTAFDTDIRVPLIVTGPRVVAGETIAQMTENIDLCPTFERLAGARPGRRVDGRSLVPLLRGREVPGWPREVLIEHHGRAFHLGDPDLPTQLPTQGSGNPPTYEAIRTATALYVEYADGEREYHDLAEDPYEMHNLAGRLPAALARRLHDALAAAEHCHGPASCRRALSLRVETGQAAGVLREPPPFASGLEATAPRPRPPT
jgi:arylsulfatase A-like enzyme